VSRAELAHQLWTDAQSNAHLQRRLRAAYRGRHDVLDALWWRAHPSTRSPNGQSDPASTLPEALAEVYSRRSSTEPLLEFLDPVSNHMVRATEADRVLRTLTVDLSRDAAALDATLDEFEEPAESKPTSERGKFAQAMARHRRGVAYSLVAGFVVGATATGLSIGAARDLAGSLSSATPGAAAETPSPSPSGPPLARPADPFRIFTERTESVAGIAPLLGAGYLPDSIRSLPDAGSASAGFGMFAAQRADGAYCLILRHPDNDIDAACATPDTIVRRGLRLEAIVVTDAPGDVYPQPFAPVSVTILWDRSGVFTTQFEPRFGIR
jgi:hypothetical protein